MTQTLSVRMDKEVKEEFSKWCKEVGMNASVAVNMFAKNVLRERKLPFEISDEQDPFYSEKNMAFLEEAVKGLEEGRVVVKTMAELKAMENE